MAYTANLGICPVDGGVDCASAIICRDGPVRGGFADAGSIQWEEAPVLIFSGSLGEFQTLRARTFLGRPLVSRAPLLDESSGIS